MTPAAAPEIDKSSVRRSGGFFSPAQSFISTSLPAVVLTHKGQTIRVIRRGGQVPGLGRHLVLVRRSGFLMPDGAPSPYRLRRRDLFVPPIPAVRAICVKHWATFLYL